MAQSITSAATAARALAAGQLAALPTETVYGLGASIDSATAVARVFEVKGRPANHPLIVHVAPDADLERWAADVPPAARALVEAFWPGPLTLVLPKTDEVPASVTGGQQTVALRAPDNEPFQEVLAELSRFTERPAAIAAPSANLFGQVSPTTAQHVTEGLAGRLQTADVILDGGQSQVGIESTIVMFQGDEVVILRPGGISAEQLAAVVPLAHPTQLPHAQENYKGTDKGTEQPRVSGSLASHYSPSATVLVVEAEDDLQAVLTVERMDPTRTGLIALASVPVDLPGTTDLARPSSLEGYANELYVALRKADELSLEQVVAVLPPASGIGVAIRDRLQRAAH